MNLNLRSMKFFSKKKKKMLSGTIQHLLLKYIYFSENIFS